MSSTKVASDALKRVLQSFYLLAAAVNVGIIVLVGFFMIFRYASWKYAFGPEDDRHIEDSDWSVLSHQFYHRSIELLITVVPFLIAFAMLLKHKGSEKYGKYVLHAQFQLTICIVTIGIILFGNLFIKRTPFSAFQLFYINWLIGLSSFVAFRKERLVKEEYTDQIHCRRVIVKNAIGNSLYQLAIVLLLLLFADKFVPGLVSARDSVYARMPRKHITMVYVAFELMTLFNMFNCRVLIGENRGTNIFKGLHHKNRLFLPIWFSLFLLHLIGMLLLFYTLPLSYMSEVIRTLFFSKPLTIVQWLIAFAVGITGLIWGQLIMALPPKIQTPMAFKGTSLSAEK